MSKCVFAPRLVASVLSLLLIGSVSLLGAQAPDQNENDRQPGGAHLLEAGQPYAILHPTKDQMEKYRASRGGSTGGASTVSLLAYRGGLNGIGVETGPKVYLVLWGSQWATDPSGEEKILESFFNGVGGSTWLASVTQYCQGVAVGTTNCTSLGGTPAGNQPGILSGIWYDNGVKAPSRPGQSQLAAEAVKAAQHFGNTDSTSNASVQYVIATAHGNNASGFGVRYCAWHSYTTSSVGNVAYTNLPYITDAGASCGANFNNLGANAGITIVEGHELAETVTDQFPSNGWLDSGGAENGDKCAWISSGQGASANVTLSSGTFPVQSLFSNGFNSGTGGCVISYP